MVQFGQNPSQVRPSPRHGAAHLAGHPPPRLSVPRRSVRARPRASTDSARRGIADQTRAPRQGARRAAAQPQQDAQHREGQEVVCRVVRGTSLSPRPSSPRDRQELVNFPRPELPTALNDAFIRASQITPALPVSTPNPSLPEHMKPHPKNGNGKSLVATRQRTSAAHRYVLARAVWS